MPQTKPPSTVPQTKPPSIVHEVVLSGPEIRQLISKSEEWLALPRRERVVLRKKQKAAKLARDETRDPKKRIVRLRKEEKERKAKELAEKKAAAKEAKKAAAAAKREAKKRTRAIVTQPGGEDEDEEGERLSGGEDVEAPAADGQGAAASEAEGDDATGSAGAASSGGGEGGEEEEGVVESSAEDASGAMFKFSDPRTWCGCLKGGAAAVSAMSTAVGIKYRDMGEETQFALQYSSEHSGADIVKGTVGLRMMYHTRGSVLRGLDEGVRGMSLGEKAQLFVRSDYGFGDVWAGYNLPPDSALEMDVSLKAIDGKGSRWFAIKRCVVAPAVKCAKCSILLMDCWYARTGVACPCERCCRAADPDSLRRLNEDEEEDDDELGRDHWSDDEEHSESEAGSMLDEEEEETEAERLDREAKAKLGAKALFGKGGNFALSDGVRGGLGSLSRA